jgi:hypothetical protein
MSFFKKRIDAAEAGRYLSAIHAGIFSDKALLSITKLSAIGFKNQLEYGRGLSEWLFFGLYVTVEGIQVNLRGHDAVGMAIVNALYNAFYSGLHKGGIGASEISTMEKHIHQRFELYNAVPRNSPERLGFAVASCILNEELKPGEMPKNPAIFGLGLGINNYYIGGLEAVNEFFAEYKVSS